MKLLAVIDMQIDFISGALGTKEAEAIVPNVCELIRQADENTHIVLTRDTHTSDYLNTLEGERLPVEHCIYKSDGWMIHPDVLAAVRENIKASHVVYNKFTFGLEMSEWENAIDKGDFWEPITEIEIIGLCTDICVISNALILRAMFRNVPITINSNCCAGVSPESHKNALEAMKLCQIDII